MNPQCRSAFAVALSLAGVAASPAVAATSPTPVVISDIDLSKPFSTHAPWRVTVTQGPPIEDPILGDTVPGPIELCLHASPSASCDPQLRPNSDATGYIDLHYLNKVEIVYPREASDHPLLFVQAASMHSMNGNHAISTQVLAYRQFEDRFTQIYERLTGANNNQETRYIVSGPLKGDIVSVEPTGNAPFGYWVSLSTLTPQDTYREALRYRSATRYNDGNSLAVIDSEMPNIEQRLGIWSLGASLPLPSGPCPKPHLIGMELWCS